MIKIELVGDTYEKLQQEVIQLFPAAADAPRVTPADIDAAIATLPIDVMKELLIKRFEKEGFTVIITDKLREGETLAAVSVIDEPPVPAKNKGGRPRKNPTVVQDQQAAVAALQNGTDIGPEADRVYVFEQMHKLYDDGSKTEAVKAFATKMAKQFNVEKISMTETGNFPVIRAALEKEFNLVH